MSKVYFLVIHKWKTHHDHFPSGCCGDLSVCVEEPRCQSALPPGCAFGVAGLALAILVSALTDSSYLRWGIHERLVVRPFRLCVL